MLKAVEGNRFAYAPYAPVSDRKSSFAPAREGRFTDLITRQGADGPLLTLGVVGTAALGATGVYKVLSSSAQASPGFFSRM